MWALPHHPLDQGGGVDADPRCHLDQARWRHIGVTLMGLGHVLVHGDMAAALGTAHMAGNTDVILEDLDSPIGEPDVHPTADQRPPKAKRDRGKKAA
jgi:formylmethanofuran dehydrogenase subunit C